MVVVCADHGELHGEHGLYGHEFCIYDPLVNVPLLVKGPGVEAGRDEGTVELQDLYHTILDYTGAEPVGESLVAERSLLSTDYRDFAEGEYGFVEYHRPVVELEQLETKAQRAGVSLEEDSRFYSRMRAARRPDGKYVRNERIPDEAYRLDRDPGETENLAADDDEVIREVEAVLAAFEERVGEAWDDEAADTDDVLDDMSEDARSRLEDLGYIE
jgi:arylsulfatase A-like enzyme